MSYLEELLPEFRKGAKIRRKSWDKKRYIYLKNNECCDENECPYDLNLSLIADDWELYKEPEPDWDYIIKNKCLCWFFDDEKVKFASFLIKKDLDGSFLSCGYKWKNCLPVRRDEVTFYEDRKDE